MVVGLLVAISFYGLGALGVLWAHRRKQVQHASTSRHYVLHARNDSRRLEWVVRCLLWHGSLGDPDICVTVVDEGSTDETPAIAGVLARTRGIGQAPLLQVSAAPERGDGTVCVHLHRPEDWHKLPPACQWVR